MAKRYKHIRLPNRLIGAESQYNSAPRRFIEELPEIDYERQKPRIVGGLANVKARLVEKESKINLPQDKKSGELKIKFYGQPKKNMLDKYGIEIYEYQRAEKAVIGKISTEKATGQNQSDLERLEGDMQKYTETNDLHSYFETVEDIEPITIEEVLESDLKEYYKENPEKKRIIDVSFSSAGGGSVSEKIAMLSESYAGKVISKVDTELVHFCRMNLSLSEVQEIVDSYNEIVDISTAPIYFFEKSGGKQIDENINIIPPNAECDPVIVIDSPCNKDHQVIKDAIVECRNITDEDSSHSTAVTSLVVCGGELSPTGDILQRNKAITIEADLKKLEETIVDTVSEFSGVYPLLLINLSINEYGNHLYDGSKKSNLTILLDELVAKHNCLFFISAGNLFEPNSTPAAWIDRAIRAGYPNYFDLPFTGIMPPADSINNISVGSITYQASPRSIAPQEHPSPITRRNIDNNPFVKPDLVHYDGNLIVNSANRIESENNGVFFADSTDEGRLTQGCGTSFATPLVAHEAGILHQLYPSYNNNSIKAILLHFANSLPAAEIGSEEMRGKLIGFGKPSLNRAKHSLSYASTIVIEDSIGMNQNKRIRIPMPKSLEGSHRKRLRIRKTLVYNPKVFPQDVDNYNPIKISAGIHRDDDVMVEGFSTRDRLSSAHIKSNAKKYSPIERSTNSDHMGKFWEIEVRSECKTDDYKIPDDYKQNFSLVITIEDMKQDEDIDIHMEISQMINIEVPIEVGV